MCSKYIKCEICGIEFKSLTAKHLAKHNTTIKQYKKDFPSSPTQSEYNKKILSERSKKSNASRKGIPRSKEIIERMKKSKRKNPRPAWNKGISMTDEQKLHLSATRKQQYQSGSLIHWNTGNTTPEETKERIKNTLLLRNGTYSEESKEKRRETYKKKILEGWIHLSTLNKGKPSKLSEEGRQKIRDSSKRINNKRKEQRTKRLYEHLLPFGLSIQAMHKNGYVLDIHCEKCGTTFSRTSSVLMPYNYEKYQGKYCPICYPPNHPGYYSEIYFSNFPKEKTKDSVFYLVSLFAENENFFKVGITTRTTTRRMAAETNYNFEVMVELPMTLYESFLLEKHILDEFKKYKYSPRKLFGGATECFPFSQLDLIVGEIFDYLE